MPEEKSVNVRDLKEALEKRKILLENDVRDQLMKFEEETEFHVTEVRLERTHDYDNKVWRVELRVEINSQFIPHLG